MKYWTKAEFEAYMSRLEGRGFRKALASEDRKGALHDGNKVRTLFYNYGSIGRPNTEPSMEWPAFSSHGYAYEFGTIVGAEVVDARGDTIHMFSDGMLDGGDYNATGGANWWGWEPLPGYAATGQDNIAMSNRPESWGSKFPIDSVGDLQWPGQFGEGVITADLESYYVMDDRHNAEFKYYPVPSDSTIRGLGIEVEARGYQYAAGAAEDIIFFQYKITNISEKRLEKVVVGMVGDPHIGGAGDFADDYSGFIDNNGDGDLDANGLPTGIKSAVRNMVYNWDAPGSGNDFGLPWSDLGWLGYKFLESPGIADDNIDNDGDGFIDESRENGLDDDGDWQATDEAAKADTPEGSIYYDPLQWNGIDDDGDGRIDDWGDLDGKSDDLNGNGVPDPGEPDFDATDIDESDMIGLTSFWAPIYGVEEANQDEVMWLRMTPGAFASADTIEQEADNVFIFGTGYFPLDPGESQNFSMAILMGQGKADLFANAQVADWVYKLGFQFSKPPDKPTLTAVSGDKKVTLYWDEIAEQSVDPVNGLDFEGYKLYRSTIKGQWGRVMTDNQGIGVAYKPIAIFDLDDDYSGPHKLPSAEGYHMDMGDNTGLVHSYVDTNLFNGLTYYYALSAFDHGDDSEEGNLPPLETSLSFGEVNVQEVMPNAPVGAFQHANVNIDHYQGYTTGSIIVDLMDPLLVGDAIYDIRIRDGGGANKIVEVDRIYVNDGVSDTTTIESTTLNAIGKFADSQLQFDLFKTEFFDPVVAEIDSSGWSTDFVSFDLKAGKALGGIIFPRDIEFRFFDDYADTSVIIGPQEVRFQIWNVTEQQQMDILLFDNDGNGELSHGDEIRAIDYIPAAKGTWSFTVKTDSTVAFAQPAEGTRFNIWVSKPFGSYGLPDHFQITVDKPTTVTEDVGNPLDKIAVVPNPYIATSGFETPPEQVFTYGRGERRVDFIYLPQACTIRIYTMAGEHVRTLNHAGTIFDGTEKWNLLNSEGHDIAPGIYIYHVESKAGNEKIGRLAIIK